jgi:sulfite dehydrogenase (cytochrome) subunit B
MMNQRNIARASVLAALVAASLAGESQSPSGGTSKPGAVPDSGQVKRITLPQVSTQVPSGPHVEVYEKNCLICHSARYLITQPRFPKAQWQAEVKKMVDAYGASISDADQAQIVEYLGAVKGSEPPASIPAK